MGVIEPESWLDTLGEHGRGATKAKRRKELGQILRETGSEASEMRIMSPEDPSALEKRRDKAFRAQIQARTRKKRDRTTHNMTEKPINTMPSFKLMTQS